MKRSLIAMIGGLLFVPLMFGCGGEDGAPGAVGPVGPGGLPGTPQPIQVLIAGSDDPATLEDLARRCVSSGIFPMGTVVDYVSVADSVPPVAALGTFDAVIMYSNQGLTYPDSLGDALADYVDAGGRAVICIAALSSIGPWELRGRMMTPGYCPFIAGGPAANPSGQIDPNSIAVPVHPIFNGTDVFNLTYWWVATDPNPAMHPGSVLLATDMNGNNRVALNASGTVAGMALFFPGQFTNVPPYTGAMQLIANACLFVAGAIGN
ncbi:MAG: hypothetical protein ACE5EO_12120 [Candidatus Krumholzibacteriia bacterium]